MLLDKAIKSIRLEGLSEEVKIHSIILTDKTIFMTNELENSLLVYSLDGKIIASHENMWYPRGMYQLGNVVLVCNAYSHEVIVFDTDGNRIGNFGKGRNIFAEPSDITLWHDSLLIAESSKAGMSQYSNDGFLMDSLPQLLFDDPCLKRHVSLPMFPPARSLFEREFRSVNHPRCLANDNENLWILDASGLHLLDSNGYLQSFFRIENQAPYRGLVARSGNCLVIDELDSGLLYFSQIGTFAKLDSKVVVQGLGQSSDGNLLLVNDSNLLWVPWTAKADIEKEQKDWSDAELLSDENKKLHFLASTIHKQNYEYTGTSEEGLIDRIADSAEMLLNHRIQIDAPSLYKWQKRLFLPKPHVDLGEFLTESVADPYVTFCKSALLLHGQKKIVRENLSYRIEQLKQIHKKSSTELSNVLADIKPQIYSDCPIEECIENHIEISIRFTLIKQIEIALSSILDLSKLNTRDTFSKKQFVGWQYLKPLAGEQVYQDYCDSVLNLLESFYSHRNDIIADEQKCKNTVRAFWDYLKTAEILIESTGMDIPFLNVERLPQIKPALEQLFTEKEWNRFEKIETTLSKDEILDLRHRSPEVLKQAISSHNIEGIAGKMLKQVQTSVLNSTFAGPLLWLSGKKEAAIELLNETNPESELTKLFYHLSGDNNDPEPTLSRSYLRRGKWGDFVSVAETRYRIKRTKQSELDYFLSLSISGESDRARLHFNDLSSRYVLTPPDVLPLLEFLDVDLLDLFIPIAISTIENNDWESFGEVSQAFSLLQRLGATNQIVKCSAELKDKYSNIPGAWQWFITGRLIQGKHEEAIEAIIAVEERFGPQQQTTFQKRMLVETNPKLHRYLEVARKETLSVFGKDVIDILLRTRKALNSNDVEKAKELLPSAPESPFTFIHRAQLQFDILRADDDLAILQQFTEKLRQRYYAHPGVWLLHIRSLLESERKNLLPMELALLPAGLLGMPVLTSVMAKARNVIGDIGASKKAYRQAIYSMPNVPGTIFEYYLVLKKEGIDDNDLQFFNLLRSYREASHANYVLNNLERSEADESIELSGISSKDWPDCALKDILVAYLAKKQDNEELANRCVERIKNNPTISKYIHIIYS